MVGLFCVWEGGVLLTLWNQTHSFSFSSSSLEASKDSDSPLGAKEEEGEEEAIRESADEAALGFFCKFTRVKCETFVPSTIAKLFKILRERFTFFPSPRHLPQLRRRVRNSSRKRWRVGKGGEGDESTWWIDSPCELWRGLPARGCGVFSFPFFATREYSPQEECLSTDMWASPGWGGKTKNNVFPGVSLSLFLRVLLEGEFVWRAQLKM